MSDPSRSTTTTRLIRASREKVFGAFTDPVLLAQWQAPGEMSAKIHRFDLGVGGGYEMSLFYPAAETDERGKSGGKEDRFRARFVEFLPPERIVEAISFDSSDPSFVGEMTMTVLVAAREGDSEVTIRFDNLPVGVRPEDNDEGTRLSLEKLAALVE